MSDVKLITSRPIRPDLAGVLAKLQAGQRIRITQTVRVGLKSWPVTITGTFRGFNTLATGLSTDRLPEDDIIVATIHFTKDSSELSSVAVDENTTVEVVDSTTSQSRDRQGAGL